MCEADAMGLWFVRYGCEAVCLKCAKVVCGLCECGLGRKFVRVVISEGLVMPRCDEVSSL